MQPTIYSVIPFRLKESWNRGSRRSSFKRGSKRRHFHSEIFISVVTAQLEDAGHKMYPLKVEYVGKVQGFDWLTQVVVRLPEDLLNAGDMLVGVNLRGAVSNKVIIGIR